MKAIAKVGVSYNLYCSGYVEDNNNLDKVVAVEKNE